MPVIGYKFTWETGVLGDSFKKNPDVYGVLPPYTLHI